MTKLLYFGLGLLIGGGIGATAAHFLTKKKVIEEAESEIEDMRQYYLEKAETLLKNKQKEESSLGEKMVEGFSKGVSNTKSKFSSEENKPSLEDIAREKGYMKDIVRESGYIDYANAASKESPEEDTGEGENMAHPDPDIWQITDEQYVTECLNYEKREFRYYIEDNTLCNEEDEVLEPKYTVTDIAIKNLLKDDVELVYVRNDMLKIDYEIQKMFGSYSEQVLGQYSEED